MQTPRKIAVAGATGRVGHHVVEVLEERGYDPVAMSRSTGVDVVTGAGLADALEGVEAIIDTATGPSPEQQAATEFFTTAARNLHDAGQRAGARRIVVVSIATGRHLPASSSRSPDHARRALSRSRSCSSRGVARH
jgi:nucleoside-diphosphate-sugar epimerase